ncbi:MAG TPA: hypothetical protein VFQ59_03235 [Candidatus Paceibacterota bacterium]|nr:hypothetical protein [Candidatus Paceibacterota bacterium]
MLKEFKEFLDEIFKREDLMAIQKLDMLEEKLNEMIAEEDREPHEFHVLHDMEYK